MNWSSRLIVEEALEGEAGDVVRRDYYPHGAQPGQGYRDGYRTGRLKTAERLRWLSCRAVSLDHPRASEGSHAGARGSSGRDVGARAVKITEFERRQTAAVRKGLGQEYGVAVGLDAKPSKEDIPVRISGNSRT
jgi:hypothetical protein